MKNRALNIFAVPALAALLATPMVFAQDEYLKANIPFDFVVSNRTLPAGTYTVQCKGGSHSVILRGVDVKAALIAITQSTSAAKLPREGMLIFNRYGNSYFLAEVWRPGNPNGNALPKSKTEREVAAQAAKGGATEVAMHR